MYSGAIDGHPESAYNASNSGLNLRYTHVRQLANRSQRMILRHTLLQRNIAEHPILNSLVSTHLC